MSHHSYGRLNDTDGPEHIQVAVEPPASAETEALLSSDSRQDQHFDDVLLSPKEKGLDQEDKPRTRFKCSHVSIAFVTGIVSCVLAQLAFCGPSCFAPRHPAVQVDGASAGMATAFAPPWVGSSTAHPFPPAKPTNAFPSMFPTSVGYAGATPTGAEPALIATAPVYPYQSGQCAKQMVEPQSFPAGHLNPVKSRDFHLFRSWGNLSPWYSNSKGTFGVDSTPEPPETCRITGLHLLHRHGARYPTQWGESFENSWG
jgi:hypothetical protein